MTRICILADLPIDILCYLLPLSIDLASLVSKAEPGKWGVESFLAVTRDEKVAREYHHEDVALSTIEPVAPRANSTRVQQV